MKPIYHWHLIPLPTAFKMSNNHTSRCKFCRWLNIKHLFCNLNQFTVQGVLLFNTRCSAKSAWIWIQLHCQSVRCVLTNSSYLWEHRSVPSWVLIFLPVNVKCLLKEFSSGRRGRLPPGNIVFLHRVHSPTLSSVTTEPHHSLPLSKHRLSSGQPRSTFSHLSPGYGPISLLPWSLSSHCQTGLWLPSLSSVSLNGQTDRSGVHLTIQAVGSEKAPARFNACHPWLVFFQLIEVLFFFDRVLFQQGSRRSARQKWQWECNPFLDLTQYMWTG